MFRVTSFKHSSYYYYYYFEKGSNIPLKSTGLYSKKEVHNQRQTQTPLDDKVINMLALPYFNNRP
jgi:hypothetical protein